MKTQHIGILLSILLISQPMMAAHLSVISWRGAERQNAIWNSKVLLPSDKGLANITDLSKLVINGKLNDIKLRIAQQSTPEAKKKLVNSYGNDPYKVAPLHYAASKGNAQIIQLLLAAGADPNIQDTAGRTPLMWAIAKGSMSGFNALVGHTDLSKRDHSDRIALHWAVSKARFKMAQTLIDKGGINAVRAIDGGGNTPLHYAASIHYAFSPDKQTDPGASMNGAFAKAAAIASGGIGLNTQASKVMDKAKKMGIVSPVDDAVSFGGGGSGVLVVKSNAAGTGIETLGVNGDSDAQVSSEDGEWHGATIEKPVQVLANTIETGSSSSSTHVDIYDALVLDTLMQTSAVVKSGTPLPNDVVQELTIQAQSHPNYGLTVPHTVEELQALRNAAAANNLVDSSNLDYQGALRIYNSATSTYANPTEPLSQDIISSLSSLKGEEIKTLGDLQAVRTSLTSKIARFQEMGYGTEAEKTDLALVDKTLNKVLGKIGQAAADKAEVAEALTPELMAEQSAAATRLATAETQLSHLTKGQAGFEAAQQEVANAERALGDVMDKLAVRTGLLTEEEVAAAAAARPIAGEAVHVAQVGQGYAVQGGRAMPAARSATVVTETAPPFQATPATNPAAVEGLVQPTTAAGKVPPSFTPSPAYNPAAVAEAQVAGVSEETVALQEAIAASRLPLTPAQLAEQEMYAAFVSQTGDFAIPVEQSATVAALEEGAAATSSTLGDAWVAVTSAVSAVTSTFTINISATGAITTGAAAIQAAASQAAVAAATAAAEAATATAAAQAALAVGTGTAEAVTVALAAQATAQAAAVATATAASEAGAALGAEATGLTIPGFQVIMLLALAVQLAIQYGMEAQKEQDKKDRRHEIHDQRNKIIEALLSKDTKSVTTNNNVYISDAPAYLTRNKEGRIPSHFAAIAGNPEPIKLVNTMMKDKSVLGMVDNAGFTALMYAIMRGRVDNLDNCGLSNKSLFDISEISFRQGFAANGQGTKTPAGIFANPVNLSPLKTALMFDMGKIFDAVFKAVEDKDVYTDAEGRTILHYAALGGKHLQKVYDKYHNTVWYTCLVSPTSTEIGKYREMDGKKNPMILAKDVYGATPLHYAAATSAQGLKFLLGKIKSVNFAELKDKNGMTPLHYAALSGKEEAAEAILNHVKDEKKRKELANMKTASKDTYGNALPLKVAGKKARDFAVMAGYPGIVKYLSKEMGETKKEMGKEAWKEMKHDAQDAKKERRADKKDEIHGASASKRMDTWQTRDIKKKTETDPMIEAAKVGRPNIVNAMIKEGYDVTIQEDGTGYTALMYAVEKGRKDMVQNILDAAEKQGKKAALLALKDKEGNSALDLTKNKDIQEMLGKEEEAKDSKKEKKK